jgi:hypothetical protein
MQEWLGSHPFLPEESSKLRERIAGLSPFLPFIEEIEGHWREPDNRRSAGWTDHADINNVMLATSLVPDGFLGI